MFVLIQQMMIDIHRNYLFFIHIWIIFVICDIPDISRFSRLRADHSSVFQSIDYKSVNTWTGSSTHYLKTFQVGRMMDGQTNLATTG
jgi:hypothetical protein